MGALLTLPFAQTARASSGNFLETMGVSIAVGTVLGASTLPFYDQPGKHLGNLAYGAAAGVVAGLGVAIYGWTSGPSQEEQAKFNPREIPQIVPVYPAIVWTPVISLSW